MPEGPEARRARVPAARHAPQSRASRLPPGRTGAEQVSAACPPGAPGTWPHRKGGAWPGGGPGPVRDEALTQVTARRAGPVTRLPSARPRPATPSQPTAVVRTADMTSVALPTGPAAFQQCLGRPALSAGSPSMHGPVNSQFAGLSIAEQAVRGAAGSAGDRQSPGPVLSISAGESQAMTAAVTYTHDRMLP